MRWQAITVSHSPTHSLRSACHCSRRRLIVSSRSRVRVFSSFCEGSCGADDSEEDIMFGNRESRGMLHKVARCRRGTRWASPNQEAPGPGFPIQSRTVRAMSPTKKRVKNIKVHVPRHNSQRIGPALTAQIETIAKEKRIRTDVRQPTNESSSVIALAIVGSHFQSTIHPLLIPTIGKCL